MKTDYLSNVKYQECLTFIDTLLSNINSKKKSGFKECVLATQCGLTPEVRTVILRKWVLKRQTLMFHTDLRSQKVKQLKHNPNCSLLFYSQTEQLQLRFRCRAHIHSHNRLAQYIYNETTPHQRELYEWDQAPSTPHPYSSSNEAKRHSQKIKLKNAYDHFCVCVCNFTELDCLSLKKEGHIRFLYKWDKHGTLSATTLVA